MFIPILPYPTFFRLRRQFYLPPFYLAIIFSLAAPILPLPTQPYPIYLKIIISPVALILPSPILPHPIFFSPAAPILPSPILSPKFAQKCYLPLNYFPPFPNFTFPYFVCWTSMGVSRRFTQISKSQINFQLGNLSNSCKMCSERQNYVLHSNWCTDSPKKEEVRNDGNREIIIIIMLNNLPLLHCALITSSRFVLWLSIVKQTCKTHLLFYPTCKSRYFLSVNEGRHPHPQKQKYFFFEIEMEACKYKLKQIQIKK